VTLGHLGQANQDGTQSFRRGRIGHGRGMRSFGHGQRIAAWS
jgi:hypothetical protein